MSPRPPDDMLPLPPEKSGDYLNASALYAGLAQRTATAAFFSQFELTTNLTESRAFKVFHQLLHDVQLSLTLASLACAAASEGRSLDIKIGGLLEPNVWRKATTKPAYFSAYEALEFTPEGRNRSDSEMDRALWDDMGATLASLLSGSSVEVVIQNEHGLLASPEAEFIQQTYIDPLAKCILLLASYEAGLSNTAGECDPHGTYLFDCKVCLAGFKAVRGINSKTDVTVLHDHAWGEPEEDYGVCPSRECTALYQASIEKLVEKWKKGNDLDDASLHLPTVNLFVKGDPDIEGFVKHRLSNVGPRAVGFYFVMDSERDPESMKLVQFSPVWAEYEVAD